MTVKEHTSLDGVWSQAEYSACGKYRYFLTRKIDDTKKPLCFIMLNPSTATEEQNDPTVERCQRRALSAGYGGIIILNLFAYRATDPKDMKVQADPVGPHNDRFIDEALHDSKYGILDIVCGWGCHGTHMDREKAVLEMFAKYQIQPKALEWTKAGHPKHPLYIPYSARPHERA